MGWKAFILTKASINLTTSANFSNITIAGKNQGVIAGGIVSKKLFRDFTKDRWTALLNVVNELLLTNTPTQNPKEAKIAATTLPGFRKPIKQVTKQKTYKERAIINSPKVKPRNTRCLGGCVF